MRGFVQEDIIRYELFKIFVWCYYIDFEVFFFGLFGQGVNYIICFVFIYGDDRDVEGFYNGFDVWNGDDDIFWLFFLVGFVGFIYFMLESGGG